MTIEGDKVFVDMKTANREEVERVFELDRDEIMAQILRLYVESRALNDKRFSDNPIILGLDFTEQLDAFIGSDAETQNELCLRACSVLDFANKIYSEYGKRERKMNRSGNYE